MNIIFSCQSASLNFMIPMAAEFRKINPQANIIFFISDYRFFKNFLKSNDLEEDVSGFKFIFLKDIFTSLDSSEFLAESEYRDIVDIDQYNFRDILDSDRRIKYGKLSQFDKIYSRQISDLQKERLLRRISYALKSSLPFSGRTIGISFACNIITDLFLSLLKLENYEFFNIRSARFQNYVFIEQQINDPSAEFQRDFDRILNTVCDSELDQYITQIESRYEGVQSGDVQKSNGSLLGKLRSFLVRLRPVDSHCEISSIIQVGIAFRKRMRRLFSTHSVFFANSVPSKYFVFPLHAEPEVSLDVYSRFSLSQAELAIRFAASLPLGVTLVCKEHPWMVGRRNREFYSCLDRISNIALVPSNFELEALVSQAEGVVSYCGSTGWLALKHRKPLFLFGESYFSVLNNNMVWKNRDLRFLNELNVLEFVTSYRYCPASVVALFKTIEARGLKINLYSDLLNRSGALSYRSSDISSQIDQLARAIL